MKKIPKITRLTPVDIIRRIRYLSKLNKYSDSDKIIFSIFFAQKKNRKITMGKFIFFSFKIPILVPRGKQYQKVPKIMNESGQNRAVVVGASIVVAENDHQESPPPYLKLIADCWEHIFDLLSLNDIIAMGETCKRMHQMAGYYLREYFPDLRFNLIGNEVQVAYPHKFHLRTEYFRYIRKLCILKRSELNSILSAETFSSLKTLIFMSIKLNEIQFGYTQNVLKNVETIQIEHCDISVGIFKQLVNYCPKLKFLCVEYGNIDNPVVAKSLFSHHIPTLEHLRCKPHSCDTQIDELKTFFEKHTKLKQFECNLPFVWANRNLLLQTNIHLDLFIIDFTRSSNIPSDQFVNFMKALYERGFYKAFQASIDRITDNVFEHSSNAISTLRAFEILDINTDSTIDLSRLTNLRELHIYNFISADMEALATNLVKLEKLSFGSVSIDRVLPFICQSKRLKSIHIDHLHENELDLFALNEKRKRLENARQVTICVREDQYLAAKWKPKYFNLSHVKVSRAGSEYF